MLKIIRVRLSQIFEILKQDGLYHLLGKIFYINKELILVKKDIAEFIPKKLTETLNQFKLVEISKQLIQTGETDFPNKTRLLKISKNLSKGYNGFALIKENRMIGDIWYIKRDAHGVLPYNPDLKWLDIDIGGNEAYLFDAFIDTAERGGGNIRLFLNQTLIALKEMGYRKIYGYYLSDNIPALWMHRLLGYQEVRKIKAPWYFKLSQIRY